MIHFASCQIELNSFMLLRGISRFIHRIKVRTGFIYPRTNEELVTNFALHCMLLTNSNSIFNLKVGCLHPVACTGSGSGFPSNATLF
jgi:hypothetical protein